MKRLSSLLICFSSSALFAQGGPAAPETPKGGIVPYCIEPMDTMPDKLVAMIPAQFRCSPGTHLKRDSRPATVVPTGEESSERPFVLRFGPQNTANAWYVRGYSVEGH